MTAPDAPDAPDAPEAVDSTPPADTPAEPPRRHAQKRLLTPKVYEIGRDISQEQYNHLVKQVGDWFSQKRATKEPVREAERVIRACMKGVKPSDPKMPWFSAANSTLAKRILMACSFDMETMKPALNASERSKRKKEMEKERKARKQELAKNDPMIPDEMKRDVAKGTGGKLVYGDDPRGFMTDTERKGWQMYYDNYISEHPELRGQNARKELESLCDLQIYMDRIRMRNLHDPLKGIDVGALMECSNSIGVLKKALNIHPEQLAKRREKTQNSDIGSIIARMESRGDWREIRAKGFLEEALMAFASSVRLNASGDDYQLNEVGLFGLMKCRTCHCSSCGTRNYVGVSVDEVKQHLVNEGVLVQIGTREPQVPGKATPRSDMVDVEPEPPAE